MDRSDLILGNAGAGNELRRPRSTLTATFAGAVTVMSRVGGLAVHR